MVTMLVTRPEPDASETARRLNALDIETVRVAYRLMARLGQLPTEQRVLS